MISMGITLKPLAIVMIPGGKGNIVMFKHMMPMEI
jgi:hypothetical protein